MTREEAIEGLKMVRTFHNGNYARHIDMAIEALKAQRWIPCSERLPEEEGGYLCTLENGMMMLSDYSYGRFHIVNPSVIAWMPLPPSYQGE